MCIRDRLKSVKASLRAAQARFVAAATSLDRASVQEQAALAGEQRAQRALTAARKQLGANEKLIAAARVRVGQVARQLYIDGQISSVDLLLSSTSPADYEEQAQALSGYSASQQRAITTLRVQRSHLAQNRARAAAAEADMATQQARAATAVASAHAATAEARAARDSVRHFTAVQRSIYQQAQADKVRLEGQVRALKREAARLAAIERSKRSSGGGLHPTGVLTWPTHGGSVTDPAGPRIHPIFHTRGCHTGIDIGQPYGADVLAAAAGIAYTQWSVPYGNVIIVIHGGGLSTMYAHLSRYNIHSGQRVRDGQVIGFIGSTGWSTGPHLHFEVHVNGIPYDPLGWFGHVKRPVPC